MAKDSQHQSIYRLGCAATAAAELGTMLSKIARTASRNRARQDLLLPSILLPQQPFTSSIGALQQAAPADDQIEVKVNGAPVQIPKGSTVMQACDAAGIDIPRYCRGGYWQYRTLFLILA